MRHYYYYVGIHSEHNQYELMNLNHLHWQIAVLTTTIKMIQKNGCDAGQHKRVPKTSEQFKASFQTRRRLLRS